MIRFALWMNSTKHDFFFFPDDANKWIIPYVIILHYHVAAEWSTCTVENVIILFHIYFFKTLVSFQSSPFSDNWIHPYCKFYGEETRGDGIVEIQHFKHCFFFLFFFMLTRVTWRKLKLIVWKLKTESAMNGERHLWKWRGICTIKRKWTVTV